MTRADDSQFPGLSVTAGGRESWAYSPERCEIQFVRIANGSLQVKCSAGGEERGVSILVEMSADFLLSHIGDAVKSERANHKAQRDSDERRHLEKISTLNSKLKVLSSLWLERDADELLLFLEPRHVLALKAAGLMKVSDICSKSQQELLRIKGIGSVSLDRILRWLEVRGLGLKGN